MLSDHRLADAELVGGGCHRAGSDVRPQDLELPSGRSLPPHQPAFRYATGHDLAAGVTFSSTNRGRDGRWVKLALPLSPRPSTDLNRLMRGSALEIGTHRASHG